MTSRIDPSRRRLLGAFAAIPMVVAAPSQAGIFSILRGAGDIRRVKMYSGRTGEFIDTIYWVDGDYIPEAMKEVNYFMRDWREDAVIKYDPRNLDLIAATQNLLETDEPYLMLSGYRTPHTNAMLRSNSRGVASNSYHMKGMAADLRMKSRSIKQMAKAALSCNAGGVGTYGRSNFVHMDCGPVRTWRG
jgi:uncharacterized protein YcbK (DUF882 family)